MHQANNACTMSCKESLIKYLHQRLFCPPKKTLLAATKNNQLTTWPGLTARAVEWYLPDHVPATDKGHMKRHKKGIRSMKQKVRDDLESIEVETCINPPLEQEKMNQLFASMAYIDRKDSIMYTDLTGNFPVRSIDGYAAFFVLYDWTTNVILATPIKDATDETMVVAIHYKSGIQ